LRQARTRTTVSRSRDKELSRFALVFAGGTLFSRVLGLVRNIVIGAFIPDASRDAFILAFRLPNMFRDMLGEGAVNAAFIPVLSETREKEGEEAYRRLVGAAFTAMALIFAVLTVVGVLLIPLIPHALGLLQPFTGTEGRPGTQVEAAIVLMQVSFPYLLLIGLAVFAMAPLFTSGHYSTPSWSPALLNIALIACCLGFYRQFTEPAWSLVIGIWVGGIAQMVVMYWAVFRKVGFIRPVLPWRHDGVKKCFVLLLPVILGQSAGEVNKLIDSFFAFTLPEGTVSALFYANQLVQLPLAVFGIAVSVAILPIISRAGAQGATGEIRSVLRFGFRGSFFLTAPSALGLIVLGEPIVRLLFGWGEFDEALVLQTASALRIYAIGLLFFSGVKVCVQGFYAVQNTRLPVMVAAGSMVLNIVLNFILVGPLGYKGLALSTVIAFGMNFAVLYFLLARRHGGIADGTFLAGLGKMTLATLVMGSVAWAAHLGCTVLLGTTGFLADFAAVVVPIACAAPAYGVVCLLLKLPEPQTFLDAIRRRAARSRS